jgi:hypothetical protein
MARRCHHPHDPPRLSGVWGCAKSRRTRGRSLGAGRRPRRRDGRGKSLTLRLLPHPTRRSGRPSHLLIVARYQRGGHGSEGREKSPRALGGRVRAGDDLRCDGAFSFGQNDVPSLWCLSQTLSLSLSPPPLSKPLSLCTFSSLSLSPPLISRFRVVVMACSVLGPCCFFP